MANTLHKNMTALQKHVYPLNRTARVSSTAAGLLHDVRNEAAKFGQAMDAKEVERQYEIMQMRMADLADYISTIEKWHGTERDTLMKF